MSRPNGALALPHQPGRVGQGTAIEQSRAAAEVFASVMSAKQAPRDQQLALRSMREACQMKELAERAFFRFPRAGSQVTGPSVHLARELARCWGNIHYGVSELRRDDEHGQSEMQAFAWDLETNARAASIFIVPHKRDKRGGGEPLTEARDIYENNANAGARRVREAIFSVLPLWFVEQAQDGCRATLTSGGGKPIQQRIAEVIDYFSRVGVGEQQLADKVGKAATQWTELDLAPLGVIYRSIKNGEVNKDDEFPPAAARVTAADITGRTPAAAPAEPPPAPARRPVAKARMNYLFGLLAKGNVKNKDARLRLAAHVLELDTELTSFTDLTADQVDSLITRLEQLDANGQLGTAAPAAAGASEDTPAEQPEQPTDTEGDQK